MPGSKRRGLGPSKACVPSAERRRPLLGGADGLSQQMKARGLGEFNTVRELGVGSQILVDLGVDEMELLTTGHRAYVGLEGYGLKVVSERPLMD